MRQSASPHDGWRLFLIVLLSGLAVTIGLLGGARPAPSWAAPAQNPAMQTIPTRPPATTPEPPPRPQPSQQPHRDNGGDEPSGPLHATQDTRVPRLTEAPVSTLPAPAESALPSETRPAPVESGQAASPSPLPSPSLMPGANSGADASRPSPTAASAAVDRSDPLSGLVSLRASHPFWLYALGLAFLLIVCGLFLIKHW